MPIARTPQECDRRFARGHSEIPRVHSRATASDGTVHEARGKAVEVVRRQPDGRWLFAIDDPFGRG